MEYVGKIDQERIGTVLAEIERRKSAKRDFVGDTRHFRAIDAEGQLALSLESETSAFGFSKNGKRQLAASLQIPKPFFDRLEGDNKHRGELARLTTHLLHTEPTNRLVRTLDGQVRAWLSPRYRTLDNADLFFLAADEFQRAGAEIWTARLTDDTFRLYAVAPGIAGEVERGGGIYKAQPDRHIAAVSISNSETGGGSLNVRPSTLREVCSNLNVFDESLRQVHLGRNRDEQGWISDETRRLEDKVLWAKVRDVIRTAFNKERFEQVIAELNGAKRDQIADPVKAVEAAVEATGLPQTSVDAIRAKFIKDQDFTRYGLVQAITFQTHATDSDEEKIAYDDAGAKILATTAASLG